MIMLQSNPPPLHPTQPPTPPPPWKAGNKEKRIDDKYTFDNTPPPSPNTADADIPNASAQYSGSAHSYLLYSLRNRKLTPYSTTTMKTRK